MGLNDKIEKPESPQSRVENGLGENAERVRIALLNPMEAMRENGVVDDLNKFYRGEMAKASPDHTELLAKIKYVGDKLIAQAPEDQKVILSNYFDKLVATIG